MPKHKIESMPSKLLVWLNRSLLLALLMLVPMWIAGSHVAGKFNATPQPLSVTRGPYLQMGTPHSIIVRWRTNLATDSRVRFGASPGALNTTVDDASVTTEHSVRLSGLSPNTTYYYSIGTTGGVLAGGDTEHVFITSPPVGNIQPIRFWVLGDFGWANTEQVAVRDAFYAFNGTQRTDLWLTVGDNAYHNGTDGEYQAGLFDVYQQTLRRVVLWPGLGNHDVADSTNPPPTQPFYQIFELPQQAEAGGLASGTENYYSFDYANVHLVSLDAQVSSRAPGSQMLTWLQNDLANNQQDWLIAFWHHPPYSKGSHDSDTELNLVEMRANVLPILEAYGVDLVLCGHSHAYERSYLLDGHYGYSTTFTNAMKVNGGDGQPNSNGAYTKPTRGPSAHQGTVYVVAGTGGTTGGGSLNHPAMFASRNDLGSLVLDINDNRLDAKFVRDTGAVEDSFTIIKGTAGNPPPTINIQPTDQAACPSGTVMFSASASGNPLPVVQWQVSNDGGANFSDLSGANSTTLTLTNLLPSQNGQRYRAVFTNPGGMRTTNAALLTVQLATGITQHPATQTVCSGAPVSFSVTATGTTPLTYQWRKNNSDLPGGNNSSYAIAAASANDAGNYSVIVTGTCGSVTSNVATLSVNNATVINTQPATQTVCNGAPVTFAVQASGTGTLTYQWRKNNSDLPGGNNSSYAIAAASANDAGNYSVIVTGTCGSATSTVATLSVNNATIINTQPATQTVCNGAPVTFAVQASGTGTLTYQWRKNGDNLPNASNATYQLAAVTTGDEGIYDVVVTGACGSMTSNGANLTVNTPVSITGQPAGQTVCVGAPVTFSATASGTGPLTYQWRRNNAPLSGATGNVYQLTAAGAAEAGTYDVVVTGACGSVTSQAATLTVNSAPGISTQPQAQAVCPGGNATFTAAVSGGPPATVQWQASSDGGANFLAVPGAQSPTLLLNNVNAAQSGTLYRAVFTNLCGSTTSAMAALTVHSFALQPTAQNFGASGGNGSVAVTVGGACDWMATSNAPWLAITTSGTGNGSGTVNYTVAANAGLARTGSLTLAGKTFTVTQDSGCNVLALFPPTLPSGTVGVAYNQIITASGGTSGYNFALLTGALPAGLGLASNGTLSGTPTVAGTFNFTVKVTDANGCTGTQAYGLVLNTRPVINSVAVTRQAGNPLSNAVIANVSDAEQMANTLAITVNGTPSSTVGGVTVAALGINAAGQVTANVLAACGAATATFTLTVTDNAGATATALLTVEVPANSAPLLTYSNQAVISGGALTITPTTGPQDNGGTPASVLQSPGTYTGSLSVNSTTGVVSISNAAPVGTHTITIRATDNCGATTNATFALTVGNNLPTISAGGTFTRQQGSSPGTAVTIATVSDLETAAGSLTVTPTTVPAGIAINSIVNNSGIITATLAAECNAAAGHNTVTLTVTDGNGGSATATLVVNVTGNSPPSLTYTAQTVVAGNALLINPATGPSDNGGLASITVQSQGTFSGTLSVNPVTGAVAINNASPAGVHTITIRVTDNCGATTDAPLILTVSCPAITITPATLAGGTAGLPYSQTLTAAGGAPNYSFTLVAGALPLGLSLSNNGNLTGIPAAPGEFSFTVRATDANGCSGERNYTLTLNGEGLMFYPLAHPIRLLETRNNTTFPGCFKPGAKIPGGASGIRTQPARGVCDGLTIPANAVGITGNITTVESGGGYLTLWPSDAAQPLAASSNYAPNEILNNVFTVGLGAADGAFKIFVTTDTDVVIDVTGYYAPPTTAGLYFHPLPKPIRLLETRAGFNGAFTPGTPLPANSDTLQAGLVTYEGVTIPATALALVGNATVVNNGAGYLTLSPAGVTRPLVASSNFAAGQVMNAPFTVGLSATGQFNIYTTTTTDLVIDVLGYYSTAATDSNGAGLFFKFLAAPVRLLETRAGFTGCYAPATPLLAGSIRNQQARGTCDNATIASQALAIVGNATVVNNQAGYLTCWPNNAAQPLVATSNFNTGQVINRHFTVGLGATGSFNIFTPTQTDLVIDVSGFFAP